MLIYAWLCEPLECFEYLSVVHPLFKINVILFLVIGVTNLDSYWQSDYHFLDKSPPSDDSRVSIYESFSRLGIKQLQTVNKLCKIKFLMVIEATLYNVNDVFKVTSLCDLHLEFPYVTR